MSALIQEISPAEPQYPTPEPIIGMGEKQLDYPVDALPPLIAAAVREVADYVQSPIALTAMSALSAASLVCQPLAKVARDAVLVAPLSLFFVGILDVNERKSLNDSLMTKAIRAWVSAQRTRLRSEVNAYNAAMQAWKAKQTGIKRDIEKLAKDDDTQATERRANDLKQLIENKPQSPLVPKLIYENTSQAALVAGLRGYPHGSILTAEGGAFFSGAAFQVGDAVDILSTLNKLWSDESVQVDRTSTGETVLDNVALSMFVAVQPEIFTNFQRKFGKVAKGSGFTARCLIAQPATTQGGRFYKQPSREFPSLDQLNERYIELLDLQQRYLEEKRHLDRPIIRMDNDAFQVWEHYYNQCERAVGAGEDAETIREEAGKSADNAARLAGIFHVIEHGTGGDISAVHMKSACRLAAWHLAEAKRIREESELDTQFTAAQAVSKRIASYCHKQNRFVITFREVMTYCKTPEANNKKTLNPVIDELLDSGHVLEVKTEGRSRVIGVNPRIVELHGIGEA